MAEIESLYKSRIKKYNFVINSFLINAKTNAEFNALQQFEVYYQSQRVEIRHCL